MLFGLSLGRSGLRLERVLSELDDFAKRGGVRGGEVGEDLAVQFDLRGLQALDEAAVGHANGADGGVDTGLPEITEGALLGLAVAEGVLPAVIKGVGGVTVELGALEAKTFGGAQCPLAAAAGGDGIC